MADNLRLTHGASTFAFIHGGFLLAGALTVLLGPILPVLAARWSLNDKQAGWFFSAQFLGALGGVILSGLVIPRQGFRAAFLLGYSLMALGAGTLGRGGWALALFSVALYGCGLGFQSAATNVWTGESNPDERASALSLVNFSWTGGAVICPFLARFAISEQRFGLLTGGLAGASVILLIASVPLRLDSPGPVSSTFRQAEPHRILLNRATLLFAIVFFLYVGAENALGGWLAAYSHRVAGSRTNAWITTPSFFWGGLLLGRALAPSVLRRTSELRVVRSGLILALAGSILFIGASTFRALIAGAVIAGLGCAAVFPTIMAWVVAYYGVEARSVAGRMLGLGILGGALLPWLVGLISTAAGSLKAGLIALLAPLLVTLILVRFLPRSSARKSQAA